MMLSSSVGAKKTFQTHKKLLVAVSTMVFVALYKLPSHCQAFLEYHTVPIETKKLNEIVPVERVVVATEEAQSALAYWFAKICNVFQVISRCSYLWFLFGPNIVSLPLLLMQVETIDRLWWDYLRDCISRSGPCFGKFAQWIALRIDLFPKVLCKNLEKMLNSQRLSTWKQMKYVLDSNLGESWEQRLTIQLKDDFPVVLGCGCVGQVVRGVMKKSDDRSLETSSLRSAFLDVPLAVDREVAIKITHPGVREAVEADLQVMEAAIVFIEWAFPAVETISLMENVEEFAKLMRNQLDMRVEADNLNAFRANFGLPSNSKRGSRSEHHLTIGFPCPIVATPDILIEDFVEGMTLSEVLKQCDAAARKRMASIGIHAVFKMVFIDNVVHAGQCCPLSISGYWEVCLMFDIALLLM
jgi:aarF domain-containing kinase